MSFWHDAALVAAPSVFVTAGCAIELALHFHYHPQTAEEGDMNTLNTAWQPLYEGHRVEIPAYSDRWMRGDRFGLVTATDHAGHVRVTLDKSGDAGWFAVDDCHLTEA